LTDAAPQTIDGNQNRRPFEYLNQPVEKGFGVAVPWFKVFFEDALGIANGFNGEFLIAHYSELHARDRELNQNLPQIVPEGTGALLTAGCCMSTSSPSANPSGIAGRSRCVLNGKELPETGKFFPRLNRTVPSSVGFQRLTTCFRFYLGLACETVTPVDHYTELFVRGGVVARCAQMENRIKLVMISTAIAMAGHVAIGLGYVTLYYLGLSREVVFSGATIAAILIAALLAIEFYGRKLGKAK
jgi:hypothetical protein